jgi:hypothetical protein
VTAIVERTTSVHAQSRRWESLMAPPSFEQEWEVQGFFQAAGEYTLASTGVTGVFARSFAVIALVVAVLASAAEPELGHPFEMKPDEVVTIQGLRITFEGVTDDSRCPTGVQCVWAGDAAAAFTLEKPPAAAEHRTLHTNGRFERQVTIDTFVVRFDDLKPYPKRGATIAPTDYRATLVVTRR